MSTDQYHDEILDVDEPGPKSLFGSVADLDNFCPDPYPSFRLIV
jgi:hypothetical protein